ncbi:hypothetical protein [Saccharopolyspora spinosa]|uniref:hypothetical protein n=1 Tax=Saccharopolyspora spinosa TaxID=60894 RepID=UPI00376EB303
MTPVQYVRVAQIAKVSEAVLYRLGNVAGGDESKQRDVTVAGTISLPSDPYAVDDDTGADGYRSLPNPKDRNRAVRFDVVGVVDDRLEFRVWAGDAGELTGNPALWQVRSELSAAMMLAGTDSAIYRELDRLMGDPDLLGYDDQVRDEGVWLEKLAEFLELLPLSEAGQAQVVQLFAWTRPWRLSGPVEGYPALVVSLPQYSVLFPAPGASKAQVVAQAYSYQLYKDTSLVVARVTSDGSGIRLRNGQAINFGLFARLLAAHKVGRGWHNEKMWTLLAIPGAPYALLSAVLQVVKGPVLATTSDVYRTTDGRLIAGDYERQSDGRVRFRPTRDGWIEFTKNKDEPSRFTGKFDLGEALMDSRTRLFLDDPVEVYRYWPARAVPVPVGLPVDAVRVPVPVDVIVGGGLAEFVRGGVAGSTGGPVVLVSQGDPGVGVVVLPGQGSDLARDLGCVVVVLTPGPVGGTPQWTVFAADGSAGPVDGSVAGVLTGGVGAWPVWRRPRLVFRAVKLRNRVRTRNKWVAEIEALVALEERTRTEADQGRLLALREKDDDLLRLEKELEEMRDRLKKIRRCWSRCWPGGDWPRGLRAWGKVGSRTSRMQWCRAGYRSRLGLIGTNTMSGRVGWDRSRCVGTGRRRSDVSRT